MMRLDFEKISMKRSKDRKQFQTQLLEGGNIEIDKLAEDFKVVNVVGFKDFIQEFALKYTNISIQDNLLHLDAIADQHLAYDQSMDFISFFYTADKDKDKEKDDEEKNLENTDLDVLELAQKTGLSRTNLFTKINLVSIFRQIVNKPELFVNYNPEQFPGLILKTKKPKISSLVFSSGKLVIEYL